MADGGAARSSAAPCRPPEHPLGRPITRAELPAGLGQRLADHCLARRGARLLAERALRGAVDPRSRLLPPAVPQVADVDHAIANGIEEACRPGLSVRAVAGDRQV